MGKRAGGKTDGQEDDVNILNKALYQDGQCQRENCKKVATCTPHDLSQTWRVSSELTCGPSTSSRSSSLSSSCSSSFEASEHT